MKSYDTSITDIRQKTIIVVEVSGGLFFEVEVHQEYFESDDVVLVFPTGDFVRYSTYFATGAVYWTTSDASDNVNATALDHFKHEYGLPSVIEYALRVLIDDYGRDVMEFILPDWYDLERDPKLVTGEDEE